MPAQNQNPDEYTNSRWHFQLSLLALLLIVLIASLGYALFFKRPIFDAFYFTLITLTTIGYSEMPNMAQPERIYTIAVILIGYATFAVALSLFIKMIVEGEIRNIWEKRKMRKQIDQMQDHIILCGYGRMGQVISRSLRQASQQFCIIDNNTEKIKSADSKHYAFIQGDAKNDNILQQARIQHAGTLICATGNDADNVFIAISARQLNKNMLIISRAVDENVAQKLRLAGADKVLLPYDIGGTIITQAALKPNVAELWETISNQDKLGLYMEEYQIAQDSQINGKTLEQLDLAKNHNILIIGHRTTQGKLTYNPLGPNPIPNRRHPHRHGQRPKPLHPPTTHPGLNKMGKNTYVIYLIGFIVIA